MSAWVLIHPLSVRCRYSGVFPSLNMAVKRREQALQDYKRLQSKVEKYEEKEKTGPVMVKLHQVRRSERARVGPLHGSIRPRRSRVRLLLHVARVVNRGGNKWEKDTNADWM